MDIKITLFIAMIVLGFSFLVYIFRNIFKEIELNNLYQNKIQNNQINGQRLMFENDSQESLFEHNQQEYMFNNEQERLMFEEQMRLFNEEMLRDQNQHFMDESLKNVTPFEMGGYDTSQDYFDTFDTLDSFDNGMF